MLDLLIGMRRCTNMFVFLSLIACLKGGQGDDSAQRADTEADVDVSASPPIVCISSGSSNAIVDMLYATPAET